MENNKTIPTSLKEMTDEQRAIIDDCKYYILLSIPNHIRSAMADCDIDSDFNLTVNNNTDSENEEVENSVSFNYDITFSRSDINYPVTVTGVFEVLIFSDNDFRLKKESISISYDVSFFRSFFNYGDCSRAASVFDRIISWLSNSGSAFIFEKLRYSSCQVVKKHIQ
jgi:hypothetical protein